MNILVRLDISKKIGTGHFRRMLNLSKCMSNHNFYFAVYTDNKLNSVFKNLNIYFLDTNEEVEEVNQICKNENIDIIILDKLHYDEEYIKLIKSTTHRKIVSFHEYQDYSEYSDLKINYNFFDGFESNTNGTLLAGPKYIIFDNEIEKIDTIKDDFIFVSFGGSDPSGMINDFVEHIALKLEHINFKIHIGNFNNINRDSIKNIEFLYQPSNLFKYMASSRSAITAGGNMMYELMYLNIPSLVVAHNKHQEEFALNAAKYNCIKYLGLTDEVSFSALLQEIETLYNHSFNKSCKKQIDNQGKNRIVKAIERVVA